MCMPHEDFDRKGIGISGSAVVATAIGAVILATLMAGGALSEIQCRATGIGMTSRDG